MPDNDPPKKADEANDGLTPDENELRMPDLTDDETAYNERGEIRRGLLDEDDRTEKGLSTDLSIGDDENVTPGA